MHIRTLELYACAEGVVPKRFSAPAKNTYNIARLREGAHPIARGVVIVGGAQPVFFGRRSSILAHACIHVAQHTLERLLDAKPTARMPVRVDMERLYTV